MEDGNLFHLVNIRRYIFTRDKPLVKVCRLITISL